jgi:hypothetical protein
MNVDKSATMGRQWNQTYPNRSTATENSLSKLNDHTTQRRSGAVAVLAGSVVFISVERAASVSPVPQCRLHPPERCLLAHLCVAYGTVARAGTEDRSHGQRATAWLWLVNYSRHCRSDYVCIYIYIYILHILPINDSEQLNRYRDGLQAWRPGFDS